MENDGCQEKHLQKNDLKASNSSKKSIVGPKSNK